MSILRKILFYFFFILYLILCPLIILYAMGYIFTPKVEEGFVKTGLIHLETLPEGASIFIENKKFTGKTPTTIRNLLPGKYKIKVSMDGYIPWARRVGIEAGRAATFDKIFLIPHELKKKILIPKPFQDLIPIPDTRFSLLMPSKKLRDILLFDWISETSCPLLPEKSSVQDAVFVKLFVSRKSPFVLLQAQEDNKARFLWCQLDKEKTDIKDLTSLFIQGEPSEVKWGSGKPEYLFTLYGTNLYRLDLEKRVVTRDWLKGIQGFGISKDQVYALWSSSLVRKDMKTSKRQGVVTDQGIFLENLFRDKGRCQIDFLFHDIVFFLGEKGELLMNTLPYYFIDRGLKGYEPSMNGRQVLLWKMDQLGTLDFEKARKKKTIFERGHEIQWVDYPGKNIEQAYFVFQSSHALFRSRDTVLIAPLYEGPKNARPLVTVRKNSSIFYSDQTGSLYYLDPVHGQLVSADILIGGLNFSRMITELEKETKEVIP